MTHDGQLHTHEDTRLAALHSLQILNTPIEERFERITRLARKALDMPICAVSCIDKENTWFKSIQGLPGCQVDRKASFCQHTILGNDPLVIQDTRLDERFVDNPLVNNDPPFLFYAGVPIFSIDGLAIAAFCVLDTQPRTFTNDDLEILKDCASMAQFELHTGGANKVQDQLIQQVGNSWRLSMIDPLTRLWNHDGINTTLGESLTQSFDSKSGLMVIMLDLAGFNEINNTIGRAPSDQLMQEFAKSLLRAVGEKHIVGRIYNDKFVIIMNTITDIKQAIRHLDELQGFVDSYPIQGVENRPRLGGAIAAVYVTGSCEYAPQSVYETLDSSMYHAKHTGEYQLTTINLDSESATNDQHAA